MSFAPDPFLQDQHRALEDKVRAFGDRHLRAWAEDEARPEERTREVARQLGQSGILSAAVPGPHGSMDLRSLVAVREALAYYSGLADSAFAMQGLGSHPLALAGTDVKVAVCDIDPAWLTENASPRAQGFLSGVTGTARDVTRLSAVAAV